MAKKGGRDDDVGGGEEISDDDYNESGDENGMSHVRRRGKLRQRYCR